MMKEIPSIFDRDIDSFRIKKGDIKVDSEELRTLLVYVKHYLAILGELNQDLNVQDQDAVNQGIVFTDFFQKKYIILSELRLDQKLYYDMLQKLKEEDYVKGYSADEIDSLRREIWGWYIETKAMKEALKQETDQLKKQIEAQQQTG